MMYEEYRAKKFSDPAFVAAWKEMEDEPSYQVMVLFSEERVKRDMSQRDLAEKSGVIAADVNKIENGNANPTLRTLQKLAKALGCRLTIGLQEVDAEAE